ncbi:Hypothetical protein CINCED_3A003654 [Cinara cedri]|nr:Hypothetical protein CINCED_3A003654 [Cinara cedri]
MSNDLSIVPNSSNPLPESATESTSEPSSISFETPTGDLKIYKNRLGTFNAGWKLDFITPDQMAKAGLYYLGKQDSVRCLFCSKEFDNWQCGDDPVIEHKKKSPQCPFVRESEGDDAFEDELNDSPSSLFTNEGTSILQKIIESLGILQGIDIPHHEDLITLEARLKTFDKCKEQMKQQDIQTLCEAGFYYHIGGDEELDQLICFCCNQSLDDFKDNDEPWTEHAKNSPTCSYVLLSKGKYFVDMVCGLIPNPEELSNNSADLEQVTNPMSRVYDFLHSKKSKLNSTKTSDKQIIMPPLSSSSQISDNIVCKICYKEEIKIVFLPCRHAITCISCAFAIDQCALCREPFVYVISIKIYTDPEQEHDDELPCSSSQCPDELSNQMMCKVCGKEKMDSVLIPCRHVYACKKCSSKIMECPICETIIFMRMPLYL